MNTRPTPISDRIVSQFRKGEATSDGLILTMEKLERELNEARDQRDRLAEVVNAANILIAAKGRHNTMLAYEKLRATLQFLTPKEEL